MNWLRNNWSVILVAAFVVVVGTWAVAAPQRTSGDESARYTRACSFPVGGWTIINCSNAAAAQSAALTAWSRYVLQCGVDSYVAFGDESTDAADANDGYLPAGSWLEFLTTDSVKYASCLNIGSDSDCRYIECQ